MPWASTASYEAVPPLPIQPTKKMAGGPKPVMPPQEMQLPAPEEYIPTQKAQPSGGSLSDFPGARRCRQYRLRSRSKVAPALVGIERHPVGAKRNRAADLLRRGR